MRIVICRLKKIIKKTPFGVDIIVAILAGNGLGKYNLVISDFLFLAVDFVCPFGLQNLTPGTPRFTHFYASLRSFKSGSLGIPERPNRM